MIRAAIVGLGWWGKHMIRRMADSDGLRIVVALDTSPAQEAFAAEHGVRFTTDWDEVLGDPAIDAVILCTPHSLHTAQVERVAKAGKHVFCEKPLALSRADAEHSVAVCRAAGVKLGIGHERRYEPAMMEIKRLVQSGALGTISHVEANFSHDKLAAVPKTDWRASPVDAPAAGMTAMGIHLTDAFLDIFGPIREVYAITASRASERANGDVVSVHTRFASGATGYLNAILVTPLYIGITVFGTEAWVEARNHTHPDTPGPTTLTIQHKDGRREVTEYEWTDTVRANLEAFARGIETGAPYVFTDEQKVDNIAVLEAICRSVATNAPVPVTAAHPPLAATA
ncbi:Gfo/Idh/MocA family oxidoreductase [Ancylobacter sp. MQZ15Z-1]|uniref:Gfo/Idh/MocA family oxidoreductase n=1 Tax=Ancylobacter mangrovi TaxID=2972472 RepID=A0A9X2T2L3_9HYPH|nr:Gfo/Idh/MocA family oxidoreductase [Ancylobacter mangrovi]MCS0496295.1 Gfo/Idh/MocA family oxidoreductase [Ancylobacter mangrovi]